MTSCHSANRCCCCLHKFSPIHAHTSLPNWMRWLNRKSHIGHRAIMVHGAVGLCARVNRLWQHTMGW
jgi:hypothetical protein